MKTIYERLNELGINLHNLEFLIGIDFGHAETSAAYTKFDDNQNVRTEIEIVGIGNNNVFYTIVSYNNHREEIGISAFSPSFPKTNLAFKCRPSIAGEKRKAMLKFMKNYYSQLLNSINGIRPDNHVVAISVPSDWNTEDQEAYRQMAIEVSIPCIFVTLESNAAMHLINNTNGVITITPENKQNGILVLDFGSSTLDMTYLKMQKGNEQAVAKHDSYELGASLIEKNILKQNKPQFPYFDELKKEHESIEPWCEFRIRVTGKETYYNQLCQNFIDREVTCRMNIGRLYFSNVPEYQNLTYNVCIDDNTIERALNGIQINKVDNYKTHTFAEHINLILDKIISEKNIKTIDKVIITGGASKMPFIGKTITSYFNQKFGLEREDIALDPNPSHTISKGVALWCKSKFKSFEYQLNLNEVVNSYYSQEEYNIKNKTKQQFKNRIEEAIWESINTFLFSYKIGNNVPEDSKDNTTQDAFTSAISECVNNSIKNNFTDLLKKEGENIINEKKKEFIRRKGENFIRDHINRNYILADIPLSKFTKNIPMPTITFPKFILTEGTFSIPYIIKPDDLREQRINKIKNKKTELIDEIWKKIDNEIITSSYFENFWKDFFQICKDESEKDTMELITHELEIKYAIIN